MSQDVRFQFLLFVKSVGWGALVFEIYAFLSWLRRKIPHSGWIIEIEDFIFWVIVTLGLILFIYFFNKGVLSSCVLVGIAVGMMICKIINKAVEKSFKIK